MTDTLKGRLAEVRLALLALHKSLVDFERTGYEKIIGPVGSPNHFLQLLTTDPWFAWLHPISELIVSLDELMDAKTPPTDAAVEAAFKQARALLAPSEIGEGFPRHYFDALQGDPGVVMAHADVMRLLGRKVDR